MFTRIRNFIRFWKYNTIPAHLETHSRKAVLFGSRLALELFRDKRFRGYLKFSEISEEEQNRIFNELTVTNLVLLMLLLDQVTREISDDEDKKEFYQALRQAVPEYFKGFIRRIGIPDEYAKIWDKLVDLRYDEYVKDALEVRGEFLNHQDLADLALDRNVVIFQAIAFGLYHHLVRGKVIKDDLVYKYIQPYLLGVYKGYLKRI